MKFAFVSHYLLLQQESDSITYNPLSEQIIQKIHAEVTVIFLMNLNLHLPSINGNPVPEPWSMHTEVRYSSWATTHISKIHEVFSQILTI